MSICGLRLPMFTFPLAMAPGVVDLQLSEGWGYNFTYLGMVVRDFSPCLRQAPPFKSRFVHLSWLQRVAFAPCLTQTSPLTARFVHPSWLQRFCTAPCLIQTPPSWTVFVHPSWMQRLIIAPCMTHIPPLKANFVHPSWPQRFLSTLAPCL